MKLKRLPNWEDRLRHFVERAMRTRFEWGLLDCCMLGADAVMAVTGHDPASDLRGAYHDQATAEMIVKMSGGLQQICEDRIGNEIAPSFATSGDIGVVRIGHVYTIGVCLDQYWLVMGKQSPAIVMSENIEILNTYKVG